MIVEARQSSFVNSVLGSNAFSSAFETSLSIEQVISIVAPSIVSIPSGTVLDELGFNTQSFALEQISVSAFQEVSIDSTMNFSYRGGSQIVPPPNVNQLYCAYSVGLNTYYTPFVPSTGCQVSQSLSVGNVALVQISVSESIQISDLLTAPQYITIV
jgi:hypothetical protein